MKKHLLLFLKAGGIGEQKKAVETLRKAGITVLAQYSGKALEVQATDEHLKAIRESGLFDDIYDGKIDIDKMKHKSTESKEIAAAWNLSHQSSFGAERAPGNKGLSWGSPGFDEPRPHSEISGDFFLTTIPNNTARGIESDVKKVPFEESLKQTSFPDLEKRLLERFKDRTQVYHLARLILIHPELESQIMRMKEEEVAALFRTKQSDRINRGLEKAGPSAAPEESCWRMNGEISVGVVFVESSQAGGPVFTNTERTTLRNEIQTGLNWLASQQPAGNLSWVYDYQYVTINVANGNNNSTEDYWRNPAMLAVSYNGNSNYTGNWAGVVQYRSDMRTANNSAHAIVVFVTPYGTEWHAYASSARLTLAKRNNWGGWGINTIDAIAAHEVCHLFGAADEYTGSGTPCTSCSTTHGCDSVVNGNCKACAAGGGVPCIMDQNSLSICDFTRGQIGWSVYSRMGDSADLAGEISELAATKFNQHQVVTAVRDGSGNLKLIAWNVAANGAISRTGDSGSAAGAATSIAIARNIGDTRVVTACRAGNNSLKLISWNLNTAGSTITRLADSGNLAGTASLIKIVAVASNLFVTACRAGDNSLKLIGWRLNANGSLSRLADSGSQAGVVQEIDMVVLSSTRVLTAVRAENGTLKLISWNITSAAITRLADSAALAGDARIIRACLDQSGRVITAVKAGNNALKLISWSVAAGGQITRLADSGSLAGETNDHDISLAGGKLTTGVRTASGNLKLILWQTAANGSFTRLGDSSNLAGAASLINQCEELTGAPPVVTSVRTGSGTLKLISWKIN